MGHLRLLVFFTLLLAVSTVAEWPDLYDNEFKRWSLTRRNVECSSSGRCFSTSDCCPSYVCATFDEMGLSPTDPGTCVHKKELKPCFGKYDCTPESRCVPLGKHRYCVPLPDKLRELMGIADETKMQSSMERDSGLKFRGEDCVVSSDCSPVTKDGTANLCCQSVRRGRMGTTKKCDTVTPISVCIEGKRR